MSNSDRRVTAEPKGTITRGEISQLEFSKPLELNEFEIHMNSRDIWHLRADSHEERMEWMRILQPNAYIVDPFKANCSNSALSDQSQPSVPPEQLSGNQCTGVFVDPIYPQLDLNIIPTTSNTMQAGFVAAGHPNTPPPAYDEIDYT